MIVMVDDTPTGRYKINTYRFVTRPTIGDLALVKLQRRIWFWWYTVDASIPLSEEGSLKQDISWGKDLLWEREAERLERKAHWSGKAVPAMEEV